MVLENTKSNLEKVLQHVIEYQYLAAKGAARPSDDGDWIIEAAGNSETVIIPNVGDLVFIVAEQDVKDARFSGKVVQRIFSYIRMSDGDTICSINIVVEKIVQKIIP